MRLLPNLRSLSSYYERGAKLFLTDKPEYERPACRPASHAFELLISPKLYIGYPRGFHWRVDPCNKNVADRTIGCVDSRSSKGKYVFLLRMGTKTSLVQSILREKLFP